MFKIIKLTKGEATKQIINVKGDDKFLFIGTEGGNLNVELILESENAAFHFYGIIIGKNSDQYNLNIISNHSTMNANSRVHVKAVMFDKSILNFNGLIKIESGALLSDAYLKNDNLVIGDDAVVNSSPQLEIKADDVKASHGVTISTINDIDQYYLRSRGLTDQQSKELLVEGFVNEILQLSGSDVDVTRLLRNSLPSLGEVKKLVPITE